MFDGDRQNANAEAKQANYDLKFVILDHDGLGRQALRPGSKENSSRGLSEPQILTRLQKAQGQEGSHDFRAQI